VRRQDGLVLWGRWRPGTLSVREETLRWADAKDPGRGVVIPVTRVVAQGRVCRDPAAEATCFEWWFRTKDGDRYVFRDGRRPNATNEAWAVLSALAPAATRETSAGTP